MTWNDAFPKIQQPDLDQIGGYIENPLWETLRRHLEETYGVSPVVEHSICGGAPGWNVKYKKGSRALCTLYPHKEYFTCLVSIGSREAMEAELLLAGCTEYVRELYWNCKPFNGGRWLMIDVVSADVLEDAKALISTRVRSGKGR